MVYLYTDIIIRTFLYGELNIDYSQYTPKYEILIKLHNRGFFDYQFMYFLKIFNVYIKNAL